MANTIEELPIYWKVQELWRAVIARLRPPRSKNHITEADLEKCEVLANDVGPMLGGFVRYLYLSGFKDRGRFKLRQITERPRDVAPNSDSHADSTTQNESDRAKTTGREAPSEDSD